MSIAETIFLGIISGLLVSAFAYIAAKIFCKIILPWYQQLIYKGLDISGQWFENHHYLNALIQESTITLKQVAHKVKGEIIVVKKTNQNAILDTKAFDFEGSFYDNFLNINCWNKNKKQLGTNNYLLSVSGDGSGFKGIKCWYDIGLKEMASEKIVWNRLYNKSSL